MTNARERAVEAGARAIVARNGGDWDETPKHWQDVYRADVATAILAAFPIQAEELAQMFVREAEKNEESADAAKTIQYRQYWRTSAHYQRGVAFEIRARIQQMAEAL